MTSIADEAFGLNQLLAPFLLVELIGKDAVLCIEEPEIHLHPKAQASLCDAFVEVVRRLGTQLVLTTHSEHILIGLLTAVATGQLKPEELAVYEFSRDGESAVAERLDVTPQGQIKGGG